MKHFIAVLIILSIVSTCFVRMVLADTCREPTPHCYGACYDTCVKIPTQLRAPTMFCYADGVHFSQQDPPCGYCVLLGIPTGNKCGPPLQDAECIGGEW